MKKTLTIITIFLAFLMTASAVPSPPDSGKHLRVHMGGDYRNLWDMHLTNEDQHNNFDGEQNGDILVKKTGLYHVDKTTIYNSKTGVPVGPSNSNSFDPLADGCRNECGDKTKTDNVLSESFVDSIPEDADRCDADGGTWDKNNDCSLAASSSNGGWKTWKPNGEIIKAYELQTNGGDGPYFYRCTSNLDGKVVDHNNERGTMNYKCDGSFKSWNEVTPCEDGVDNDGDRDIDNTNPNGGDNDPDCDSNSDLTESESINDCSTEIIREADGDLYAKYDDDGNPSNGCGEDYFLSGQDGDGGELGNGGPDVFVCTIGTVSGTTLYDHGYGQEESQAKEYCENVYSVSEKDYTFANPEGILIAQYWTPKEAIPTGSGSDALKFYNEEDQLKNYQFMDLAQAESRYGLSSEIDRLVDGDDGYDQSNSDGAPNPTAEALDEDNIDLPNWPNNNFQSIVDAGDSITVASAGADYNNNIVSPGDTYGQQNFFPGGFAGNCAGERKWRPVNGDWLCALQSGGSNIMKVTFYDVHPGSNNRMVGFQINNSEVTETWNDVYPYTSPEGGTNYQNVEVRAQCWLGSSNNRPTAGSGKLENLSTDYSPGNPIRVIGQVPDRSNADASTFSCIFGLRQNIDATKRNVASNVRLYRDGNVVWNQEVAGGAVNSNPSTPMYITQGTNDHPLSKINVNVENIGSINGQEIDLTWLEQNNGNTDTISAGTDPFQNFFKGDSTNPEPRHPVVAAQQ